MDCSSKNIIQIALWIAMAISLMGSYFNATMRLKLSYIIWLMTNAIFMWRNFSIGEIQQGVLYTVLLFLAMLGVKSTFRQKGWLKKASIGE